MMDPGTKLRFAQDDGVVPPEIILGNCSSQLREAVALRVQAR